MAVLKTWQNQSDLQPHSRLSPPENSGYGGVGFNHTNTVGTSALAQEPEAQNLSNIPEPTQDFPTSHSNWQNDQVPLDPVPTHYLTSELERTDLNIDDLERLLATEDRQNPDLDFDFELQWELPLLDTPNTTF